MLRSAFSTLALALLAVGCTPASGSSASPLAEPALRVLTQSELEAACLPRDSEEAVLVNIWATWCGPCIREMPELVELHHEWKDKGIRVQTIAVDVQVPQGSVKTAEDVFAFMQKRDFDLPVIVPKEKTLGPLQQAFQLNGGIPVSLVIDKSGEVVARQEGAASKKVFERMIKRAIGG